MGRGGGRDALRRNWVGCAGSGGGGIVAETRGRSIKRQRLIKRLRLIEGERVG